jgi:hypothetical protein
LVIAANSGEAADDQLARLDEIIRGDRQMANYAATLLDQQASLAWMGSMRADPSESSACALLATEIAKECAENQVERTGGIAPRNAYWIWPTIAVGIGFVLGGLTAAMIYRAVAADAVSPQVATVVGSQPAQPSYEAHLIRSTACLWDGSSLGSREIGSELASGESLHLLEGLAEFTLNWAGSGRATLSLEGPAAMMLTTQGMPTLRFGRLSATINTSFRPFVLETSVGRLSLAEYGSIGVSSFGNEGEIHVFNGVATFEPAWRSPEQTLPLRIEAGQSIRIQTGDDGEPKVLWHAAEPEYFAAQVSMTSDGLTIPAKYVAAVKKSQPIGYWRFDRDEWPKLPNVMGSRLSCEVTAALGKTVYQNNEAVEFGTTPEGGEILSTDLIDESIRDSYSFEFWVKPSHYHLGSVVSLVGDEPAPSGVIPHGMLIELGGTGKVPTAIHHPGCIRFLHRSPARDSAGTSCYSKTAYNLRKWQHVVATKDGPNMRLYINGDLVAEGVDPSPLPTGLRLLVGKLYPSSGDRPFIGQLDELALYNRALRPEEISKHFHLVRPKAAREPAI